MTLHASQNGSLVSVVENRVALSGNGFVGVRCDRPTLRLATFRYEGCFGRLPAVGLALAFCLNIATLANAAESWATGTELQQQLTQRISIVWSAKPLRQALESLSRTQKVAIVLDRRVDGGQKIDLSINDTPLEAALQLLAQHCKLELVQLGSVLYLGPPEASMQLRTLALLKQNNVRRLPSPTMRKFQQTQGMAWDDLAEPRGLLADLGRANDLTIDELERIPHDLWPAAELPPMPLVDRLTLMTSQFELTFNIAADGRKITLASIPEDLQKYRHPSPSTSKRSKKPPAKQASKQSGTKQTQPLPPAATLSPEPTDDVELIRIERLSVQEKPLGPVLRQLADRLKLDLRMDERSIAEAGISLEQRVSVSVDDATIDDILGELLKTTGLAFRRTQKTLEVFPAR